MRPLLARPLLAVLAIVFGCGAAHAAHFTDAQLGDLKRVSGYLNGIQTLKGNFMQINPDGTSGQGVFYMKKPGFVRFEYAPPNPNLIISDGRIFAVENRQLNTQDTYPVVNSPLKVLLSPNIDLAKDYHTTGVRHEPGLLIVTAREIRGPAQGELTLTFSDPGLELRQWDIVDAQGLKTTVIMNNVQFGVDISPDLFIIPEGRPFRKSAR